VRPNRDRHKKNTNGKGYTEEIKMKGPCNKSQKGSKGRKNKRVSITALHEQQTYYYCAKKADTIFNL
jgi:hypothetical protein